MNHRVGIGLTVFSYFFKLFFCVNHRVVCCRQHLSNPVAGVGDPLSQRDLVSVSRVGLEEGGGTMHGEEIIKKMFSATTVASRIMYKNNT